MEREIIRERVMARARPTRRSGPIGKTACFIRQLLGEPLVHFFFASRVQLPTKVILELQNHISSWTEGVTFEPNDPNMFQFALGDPVVPSSTRSPS